VREQPSINLESLLPYLGALVALSLVFITNGPLGPAAIHCGGALHRPINLLGCALLIASNRVAHQRAHKHAPDGKCCNNESHNH